MPWWPLWRWLLLSLYNLNLATVASLYMMDAVCCSQLRKQKTLDVTKNIGCLSLPLYSTLYKVLQLHFELHIFNQQGWCSAVWSRSDRLRLSASGDSTVLRHSSSFRPIWQQQGGWQVYPQASLPLPPTSRCPNPASSGSTKHWHTVERLVRQAQSWH